MTCLLPLRRTFVFRTSAQTTSARGPTQCRLCTPPPLTRAKARQLCAADALKTGCATAPVVVPAALGHLRCAVPPSRAGEGDRTGAGPSAAPVHAPRMGPRRPARAQPGGSAGCLRCRHQPRPAYLSSAALLRARNARPAAAAGRRRRPFLHPAAGAVLPLQVWPKSPDGCRGGGHVRAASAVSTTAGRQLPQREAAPYEPPRRSECQSPGAN